MANANEAILLVLISKRAGSFVWQWGKCMISLNRIYKLTHPGWPFWAIVVQDVDGHSWPVALIIALIESKDILMKGLKIVPKWRKKSVSDGNQW
jgi:hypothetical protein